MLFLVSSYSLYFFFLIFKYLWINYKQIFSYTLLFIFLFLFLECQLYFNLSLRIAGNETGIGSPADLRGVH